MDLDTEFENRFRVALSGADDFLIFSEGEDHRLGVEVARDEHGPVCQIELMLKIGIGTGRTRVSFPPEMGELFRSGMAFNDEFSAWLPFYMDVHHEVALSCLARIDKWLESRPLR